LPAAKKSADNAAVFQPVAKAAIHREVVMPEENREFPF
jgi:hypothetical protein